MSESVSKFLRNIRLSTARTRPIRTLKPKRRRRFMKYWAWDATETSKHIMENKDLFLGASDVSDYLTSQVMIKRCTSLKETITSEFTVIATSKEWAEMIDECGLRKVQIRENNGYLFDDEGDNYLNYEITASSSVQVKVYGDVDFVNDWYDSLVGMFEEVKNVIEWIYGSDGQSIEIPVRSDRKPVDEMYPFLDGRTLEDYYDSFMSSSASILLLIGPPGTGKTTFIRGLLQHAEVSAMVTYDASILAKDYLFAQFIEGDRNVMIIEDADNFLGARSDGNDFMHKFLNVGDGLVTTKNKKMIFSTNLPSIRDIDSALIRPGRCFDILHFDNLDNEQALKLTKKLDIELDGEKDKWSLAELFHKQVDAPKSPRRKLGFV